jgi:hypothetical protein
MLLPTSLPTIYDLVDPEANLAGGPVVGRSVSSYEIEALGAPLYVAADGTPIGDGNNCAPLLYPTTTPLGSLNELRQKEVWAIALAGASAYLAWVLFFGKRTPGRDRYYGSSI